MYGLFFSTETDDYIPPRDNVVFVGDSPQEKCINIGIVNDDILENPESFLVLIESNITHGVSLNPNSTIVLIVGSEGEC